MGILRSVAIAIILLWLILWLAVKVTVGFVHILVVVGLAMLVISFLKKN